MSRLPEDYLRHILDETNYLLQESQGLTATDFHNNPTLQKAFVRSLEIIGEATKNLPPSFTKEHSSIDWRSIAGMRDRLIHGYFGVDYTIVWDVIKTEVPKLNQLLNQLL